MHKIIFDTDPGIDDAMAILFAAFSQQIELLGLTTVHGNATIHQTTENALYLCDRFGWNIPVARGTARPLTITPTPPPYWIHGEDGMGNLGVRPQVMRQPDVRNAPQFILDHLRAAPGEVTLVAVGPLTNLAYLLSLAPEAAQLAKEVIVMGGAFGCHGHRGNITEVAEANFYNDPHAADQVLCAEWPVTVVGLDVTHETIMKDDMLADFGREASDHCRFIHEISHVYRAHYHARDKVEGIAVHDYMALAYLVAPHLFEVVQSPVRVLTEGPEQGRSVQLQHHDPAGQTKVCTNVRAQAVLDLYFETVTRA